MRTAFITGTAGFIGHHLAAELLANGWNVVGYDGITDYYDVELKRERHRRLAASSNHFTAVEGMLEDVDALEKAYGAAEPDVVVHLAAQAGVRYSLEHPRSYVESNIVGTFNVMEMARRQQVATAEGGKPLSHLLFASTSSVYGGNTDMPFTEDQRCDSPLTIYAATKKATEELMHSYAHLYRHSVHGFPLLHRLRAVGAARPCACSSSSARWSRGGRSTSTTTETWCATSPMSATSSARSGS